MTIQGVPTEILAESLLAVQDLRRKYQDEAQTTRYAASGTNSVARCPLCKFRDTNRTGEEEGRGCEELCPWYWIENHHCEEWDGDNGDLLSYDDFPIPDRLARIDRWELAITEELASRRAEVQP